MRVLLVTVVVILIVCASVFYYLVSVASHSRIYANEMSALMTLRSNIFPAQMEFQSQALADRNKNGVGEYAFFDQLAAHHLLDPPLKDVVDAEGTVSNGPYHFTIYLPDGQDGFCDQAGLAAVDQQQGVVLREFFYIAVAWPESPQQGRHVYVILPNGDVHVSQSVEQAEAFMADPGWQHFYKAMPEQPRDLYTQWPSDDWPALRE